jgi:hypothetical protein
MMTTPHGRAAMQWSTAAAAAAADKSLYAVMSDFLKTHVVQQKALQPTHVPCIMACFQAPGPSSVVFDCSTAA